MKIGYGRVSTRDQNPEAQHNALAAAGCDQVFIDKAAGKLARRRELDLALLITRAGDQLVVTKRVVGGGLQDDGCRAGPCVGTDGARDGGGRPDGGAFCQRRLGGVSRLESRAEMGLQVSYSAKINSAA